ncbi:MAG: lipoyl(octanoyl) transferase LipB [Desulfosalsimonadaceae bacterium]
MDYLQVLRLQQNLVSARANRTLQQDILLLLEHFPVFTLGNRGGAEHLHVSREFLQEQGIDLIETGRGGSITYHGPGQLMAYPIVDLACSGWQVAEFVRALENVMISIAGEWGLDARGDEKDRGAWIRDRKIGSIGLRVRRKISFHGLALNAAMDLTPFSWITPCGLSGIQMTSIAKETGGPVSISEVSRAAKKHFSAVFGVRLQTPPDFSINHYTKEQCYA